MLFSTLDVTKLGHNYDADTLLEDIAQNNLDTINRCKAKNIRCRLMRGNLNGRKIAVVIEATSFLAILCSYLPSLSSLKNRFLEICLEGSKISTFSRDFANTLREHGPMPWLSKTTLERGYFSKHQYNPWPHLYPDPDLDTYKHEGSTANESALADGSQIGFYHKGQPNDIFSNMERRDNGEYLSLIEFPGVISTSACPEILFQAGKFNSKPELKKSIMNTCNGTDAIAIARGTDPKTHARHATDPDFYAEERELQLMLKIVRTRAQQDPVFRKKLVATHKKPIYEVAPHDKKWGCVKSTDIITGKVFYEGTNYLGRILEQARQECIDNDLPEVTPEEVRRSRGIKVLNTEDKNDFMESTSDNTSGGCWSRFCNLFSRGNNSNVEANNFHSSSQAGYMNEGTQQEHDWQ